HRTHIAEHAGLRRIVEQLPVLPQRQHRGEQPGRGLVRAAAAVGASGRIDRRPTCDHYSKEPWRDGGWLGEAGMALRAPVVAEHVLEHLTYARSRPTR